MSFPSFSIPETVRKFSAQPTDARSAHGFTLLPAPVPCMVACIPASGTGATEIVCRPTRLGVLKGSWPRDNEKE